MTDRGLVRKERCDDDRRGANVVATKKGRRATDVAAPHHVTAVRRLFVDRLTNHELDVVASVAEKILEVLDADEVEART